MDEPEAPTMNAVDNGVVNDMDLIEDSNDQVDDGFIVDMDFNEDSNDLVDGDFVSNMDLFEVTNDVVDSASSVDEPRDEMFIDNLVSSEESDLTDVSSYDEQDPDCRLFLIMIT